MWPTADPVFDERTITEVAVVGPHVAAETKAAAGSTPTHEETVAPSSAYRPNIASVDVSPLDLAPIANAVPISSESVRPSFPLRADPAAPSLARAESPAAARWTAEWTRLVAEVQRELDTFEVGDSKARVIAVQGPPDEAGSNIFRYGSSVVYFKQGFVTDWTDRVPRLRVRASSPTGFGLLDTFTYRSTRAEVIRAQGLPTAVTSHAYYYGASAVYFDREWVTRWSEVDRPLKTSGLANLPITDLAQPPSGVIADPRRVAPNN